MIGDTLSSRSADTLSLLRQNQTSPAKADTDSLQLVDLHAVQEVDSGFEKQARHTPGYENSDRRDQF